ncbi:GAF and ANTAR domain-containing protein (plasmid) [Streptomyces sp. BH-SS-21]|uniref:GAF and ANTAR domain-containing protein n=1 Tax=Streptomyces liliiviolaceus TaxID=2823109 RepID=A0A940YEZ9_9ACTN|nr:GAF and ANTAR domain-containing protein [Streptomyces liliiviolaceus]MBQ0855684.1 GAF and ANTAR domain-containing protein [Streptomyces liliiviolaceus]
MTGTSAIMARILRDLPAGSGSGPLGGDPARCARALAVDGIAVSLGTNGSLTETVWSTPGRSALLEDIQFTLGEGPGLDAYRNRSLIAVGDLEHSDPHRWPAFLPEAARLGVRALFCFPLHLGAASLGVLTAQRASAAALDPAQIDDALVMAAAITSALILHGKWRESFAQAEPHATLHRAAVHQAAGIISVQANASLTEAMAMLRAHAYRTEQPLLTTADEVVARRLHFRNNRDGTATPSTDRD